LDAVVDHGAQGGDMGVDHGAIDGLPAGDVVSIAAEAVGNLGDQRIAEGAALAPDVVGNVIDRLQGGGIAAIAEFRNGGIEPLQVVIDPADIFVGQAGDRCLGVGDRSIERPAFSFVVALFSSAHSDTTC